MKEDFLHFVWRTRRFHIPALQTLEGHDLQVLHPGELNTHAGPDFFNARIRLDDTEWAGNVEMHLKASDWYAHGHQTNYAYDNVILHVVWEADAPIARTDGSIIPTLCLRPYVDNALLENYQQLIAASRERWIPCAQQIENVPDIIRLNWLDRLLVERLAEKTEHLALQLKATNNNWEESFYHTLARSFGLQVNAEPFETLARSLPLNTLSRHKNSQFTIEALLFGQAGMLAGPLHEPYPARMAKEYEFLKTKYSLQPMHHSQWKYLRLRPANFPTIRIAQFAALLYQSTQLFSYALTAETARELEHLFTVQPDDYWQTHYQFNHPTTQRPKTAGRDFTELLLINTVIPAVFYYGKMRQLPEYQQKALRWLEELKPEKNSVIDGWKNLDIKARDAYQSQALLQLKKHYCDQRRCVSCAMGNYILGRKG
jgi:Protein of unknown function (DUF2851)